MRMSYNFSLDSDSIMGDFTFLFIIFKYIVIPIEVNKEMIKNAAMNGEK